jgi:hypothetical protein
MAINAMYSMNAWNVDDKATPGAAKAIKTSDNANLKRLLCQRCGISPGKAMTDNKRSTNGITNNQEGGSATWAPKAFQASK